MVNLKPKFEVDGRRVPKLRVYFRTQFLSPRVREAGIQKVPLLTQLKTIHLAVVCIGHDEPKIVVLKLPKSVLEQPGATRLLCSHQNCYEATRIGATRIGWSYQKWFWNHQDWYGTSRIGFWSLQ